MLADIHRHTDTHAQKQTNWQAHHNTPPLLPSNQNVGHKLRRNDADSVVTLKQKM